MIGKPKVALAILLLLVFVFSATGCGVAHKISNSVKAADDWVTKHAW